MKSLFISSFLCVVSILSYQKATAQYDEFKDPFEGEQGFYKAYFQGDYDAETVLKDLGNDFELILAMLPCH